MCSTAISLGLRRPSGSHPGRSLGRLREMERNLVYDVGLHRGEDSAMYLAQGYQVIAFEANPDLCRTCRERFSDAIASGQLTLVEGAITDSRADTVTFYMHPTLSIWGTTDRNWADRNRGFGESRAVTVPAVNFSEWLKATGVPFFMKVDIEGADQACFAALLALDDRPAYVSRESSKTSWRDLVVEFDLLERLGYDSFAVAQQKGAPAVRSLTTVDDRQVEHQLEPNSSGPFGVDVQRWESRRRTLLRFRGIFVLYRLIGDGTRIRNSRLGLFAINTLERWLSTPLPGWYDLHARRAGR